MSSKHSPHAKPDRRVQTRSRSQRRLLVNPRFQLWFLAGMSILALIVISCAYVITRYYLHQFESTATAMGLSIDHALFGLIKQQREDMAWVFGFTALAILFVLGLGGLALSHLIAGPIHRLETHMKRIESENASPESLHPVSFRSRDFFPELAAAYNGVLQLLRRR